MAIEDERRQGDDAEEAGAEAKRSGVLKWVLLGLLVLLLVGGTAAAMYLLLAADGGGDAETVAESGEAEEDATAAAQTQAPAEPPPPRYEPKSDDPAIYFPISPALTVNFSNPSSGGKYLQVLMEVMSRDRDVIDALKDNMPVIRNDLILLLGEQDPVALRSAAGKQRLQAAALRTMQRALARENRRLAQGIEAVYFTKFVIQ